MLGRGDTANTLWTWILAGLVGTLLIVVALLARAALDKKQPDAVVQLEIVAPERAHLSPLGSAISPDGRYVAFVANSDGKDHLWLRPLNARTARILEDTEDAQFPFWSPDSSSIGFFAGTKLKRFDLNGIGTRTLATAPNGRGGTWSRDGVILYSPNLSSRLWKVSAAGGEPTPVTVLDDARGDARHNFPQFLPDGKHFLFVLYAKDAGRSGTYVGTLEDPSKVEPIPELKATPFKRCLHRRETDRAGTSSTHESDRLLHSCSTGIRCALKARLSQLCPANHSALLLSPAS